LSFDPPAEESGVDEYLSDPNHPVPFVGYTTDTVPQRYMVDDQRFASYRPDVLVYQTEPLQEDVTIAGPITPRLKIASSGTDSDFDVKLIDVYAEEFTEPNGVPQGNKRVLDAPPVLYVDGAYVSSEALTEAREQGRELRGPAPASPDRGKVFTVEAFDVHVEDRYAVCPAGKRSGNCSRLEEKSTGNVDYRIEWSKTVCSMCQLQAQCVSPGQDHRTFVVGELHSILQDRRREMQTETFKKDMHRRNGIEGTHSELVRGYGMRHARYRGKAKMRLQNYLIGAACNIRRLFRRIEWLTLQALKAIETDLVAIPA